MFRKQKIILGFVAVVFACGSFLGGGDQASALSCKKCKTFVRKNVAPEIRHPSVKLKQDFCKASIVTAVTVISDATAAAAAAAAGNKACGKIKS